MINLPYAEGAWEIANARKNGMRPAGPVIVALNGDQGWDNATVYADPAGAYRWDWVKGLPSIVVVMGKDTRLGTILRDIEDNEPGQLDVIDTDRFMGWMILSAKPKLSTLRWPKWMVRDWLGDGHWHKNLNETKASFGLVTA